MFSRFDIAARVWQTDRRTDGQTGWPLHISRSRSVARRQSNTKILNTDSVDKNIRWTWGMRMTCWELQRTTILTDATNITPTLLRQAAFIIRTYTDPSHRQNYRHNSILTWPFTPARTAFGRCSALWWLIVVDCGLLVRHDWLSAYASLSAADNRDLRRQRTRTLQQVTHFLVAHSQSFIRMLYENRPRFVTVCVQIAKHKHSVTNRSTGLPTGLPTGLQPDCLHGLRTAQRFVLVFPFSSFSSRVCIHTRELKEENGKTISYRTKLAFSKFLITRK